MARSRQSGRICAQGWPHFREQPPYGHQSAGREGPAFHEAAYGVTMDAETQLAEFVARFSPEVQDRIRDCRSKVEARFPTAVQLIYDNYNFLVISFGPTDRPSDVVLSLAAYASGLNLNFLQRGPELPDPASILRGTGKVVRNVRLDAQEDLDRPEVIALIDAADALASVPIGKSERRRVIIKSVSAKQRPRR